MKRLITPLLLSLSLSGLSQQKIYVTVGNGDLYTLDLANCTSHRIGPTNNGFGDIAITPDGRLWGIVGGQLYQINTSNANTTLVGSTGLDGVSLVELNDSTLLIESDKDLYAIKTTDASVSYIGVIGYQATGDLTWYDNDLYMTSGGFLVRIVLNNNNSAIISSTAIDSAKSQTPGCEGAVTATFPNQYNAIVGFSGPDVYKICQIDGSAQLLCSSIVPDGISGAASLRLPTQHPQPVSCTNSGSASPADSIFVSPNPGYSLVTITGPSLKYAYLIDDIGRRLTTATAIAGNTPSTIQIDVSKLAQAIYFIVIVTDEGQRFAKKLLVVHP